MDTRLLTTVEVATTRTDGPSVQLLGRRGNRATVLEMLPTRPEEVQHSLAQSRIEARRRTWGSGLCSLQRATITNPCMYQLAFGMDLRMTAVIHARLRHGPTVIAR